MPLFGWLNAAVLHRSVQENILHFENIPNGNEGTGILNLKNHLIQCVTKKLFQYLEVEWVYLNKTAKPKRPCVVFL